VGDIVVIRDKTLSSKEKKIVSGLCPLYSSTPVVISKVISATTYEVTFPDGSLRGPLHVSLLRRYHSRTSPENSLDRSSDPPSEAEKETPHTTTPDIATSDTTTPSTTTHTTTPKAESEDTPAPSRQLRQRKPVDYRKLHLGRQ